MRYEWAEIPEDQKNVLPPEFRNIAFKELFAKAAGVNGCIIKHFEAASDARAILVNLALLLKSPGVKLGGLTLKGIEEAVGVHNITYDGSALIISTTEHVAVRSLLEEDLPSNVVGVQNTPACKEALNQATQGLGTEVDGLNATISIENVSPRAEFPLYFVGRIYAADLVSGNQKAAAH
jgi:hypothetical protein